MKRALKILGAALLLLVAALVGRTVTAESRQRTAPAAAPLEGFDLEAALERLASAIRLRTQADAGGGLFDELYVLIADGLPALARLQRRDFPRGVLFTWTGSDPSLEPLLLLAHADVVPVDRPEAWTHPPFAGRRADGFLWGRGALDDKASLMAQLEAAAWLVEQGFRPKRTVLFAFGHDEETAGKGAAAIADHLEAEGVRAHLVLDEGGMVTQGVVPGVERPVAIVGIAEKDAFSVRLTAEDVGGHASMPPPHTAAGRIGRAVALLEANPWPLQFTPASEAFMDWLAPEMPFGQRLALRNRWLLGGAVKSLYAGKPRTAAQVRTTTAVTMLSGGPQANVLPQRATAVVNYRVLPGTSRDAVLERTRQIVKDPRVQVEALPSIPPRRDVMTDPDGPGFRAVQAAINGVFPDAVVVPYLVVGITDARHYTALSDHVLRFAPGWLGPGDTDRIHGTDERIREADYGRMVQFYAHLIRSVQPE